jgi:ribosomal protein S18 acetylase RimI-like enzyme
MVASGLPWSIFSRAEPSADLVAVAAEYGLTRAHRSPVMVRGTEPVRPASGGRATPMIRRITVADLATYTDVLTAGFEAPPEMLRNLMSPELIAAPEISAYLLEHHGEPVAVGLGTVTAGLVGVYNIATPPPFRSRGYGRLVTEAVIRDGLAAGAKGAYLLASDLGQPLYRSLGFETIDTWTYLMS